ncbi:MAG: alpha/beta hydrolase [Acidobacteriia bacterium]|nr:alpha/beta hydrolase [Terriglobia bacterium]
MQTKANHQQLHHRTPDGLNLSLRMWGGHGPPQFLLLHGYGDNALVWDHFASALGDSCCPLAMDLRGHGHSEWDPRGIYALPDFVADAVNVLDELCPAPVVLVGHSLGAQIAMRAAAARRERIRAVVLVDVALRANEASGAQVHRKFRERQRVYDSAAQYIAFLRGQLPLARVQLLNVLAEGALRVREDGHCEERCDPMLANMDDSIDRLAIMVALKQIARPILFVRGAGSAVLSRATAREVLTELAQSRVSTVAAAGHTVMLDNPDGFSAAVMQYIGKFSSELMCDADADRWSRPDRQVRELLEPSNRKETP